MKKSPQRVWYFAIHGRRVGPFTEQEMSELVKSGSLRPDTLVWNPALGGWQRLAEVPALARHLDPAAPPPSAVFTEPVDYAGFWRRVAARLIDGFVAVGFAIPFVLVLALLLVLFTVLFAPDPATEELIYDIVKGVFVPVFAWLYIALQISSPRQATYGMQAMGLMVTDVDGRRVSFVRATWRFVAEFVFNPLTFGLGYLLAAFTRRKQALHDLIAETVVIRRPEQRGTGQGGRAYTVGTALPSRHTRPDGAQTTRAAPGVGCRSREVSLLNPCRMVGLLSSPPRCGWQPPPLSS